MKGTIITAIGAIGSFVAGLFGGWDTSMTTLVIFMLCDYISGLIVAGVFHKSNKTESGSLESKAGWKGLFRKGMTLLIVLIACRLDMTMNTDYLRDGVCIAFIANETISLIENAGLMGVPIPNVITGAIEVLKNKKDND